MRNLTLVSTLLLAALVVTNSMTSPVLADKAFNQSVIVSIKSTPDNAIRIFSSAIENICKGDSPCYDHDSANQLLSDVIETLGPKSSLIEQLLMAAIEGGMDADIVTSIAIANGVDATLASAATAAGPRGNNANENGTSANSSNANANAGAGNNNAGGVGRGGGGGGISRNQ